MSHSPLQDPVASTLFHDGNSQEESTTRFLAGGGNEEPLDYSVVSVGVMTLGLLLLVEVIRHRLDHSAMGRPFFKTVLEGVYSECTYGYCTVVPWSTIQGLVACVLSWA